MIYNLTVVIFADRESDISIGECETCDCMCKFNSAYHEAARVYTEFGYAAPKILLWALETETESKAESEPRHQQQLQRPCLYSFLIVAVAVVGGDYRACDK